MRETGENYSAALAVERSTRPPPRKETAEATTTKIKERTMTTKPAVATRLRGVWFGVKEMERSREFYERLGAYFDDEPGAEGVVSATLGGMRLNFETSPTNAHGAGYILLFDVTDADVLHAGLKAAGCNVTTDPINEPWGRRFNVHDPDGHEIAFIGPIR